MFNSLTLKQRVIIQLVLNIGLQVVIVTGLSMGWDRLTLILCSLGIGAFMLWLYLDSAMASAQFVNELISGAQRMGQGDLTRDVSTQFGNPTLREGLGTMQALQQRVRAMLSSLNDGAWQVSNASSEIAAGNQDLSRRTEQGSAQLQSASQAMKQMTDAAAQSSDAMQKATSLSQNTSALVPSVLRTPATGVRSLMPIGRPASHAACWPWARLRLPRSLSAARARSGHTVGMALMAPSTWPIRVSAASRASLPVISPLRNRATTSVAVSRHSSGPLKAASAAADFFLLAAFAMDLGPRLSSHARRTKG